MREMCFPISRFRSFHLFAIEFEPVLSMPHHPYLLAHIEDGAGGAVGELSSADVFAERD